MLICDHERNQPGQYIGCARGCVGEVENLIGDPVWIEPLADVAELRSKDDGVLGEMLIRTKGCSVLGLDVSAYAREMAAKREVNALHCDISEDRFPVDDDAFDVATMLCCLEHIFDPGHALREAARAVRPGGRILVTLPNAVSFRFRLDFLRGRLSKDLLHTNDGEGLHIRFFNFAEDFEAYLRAEAPTLRLAEKIPALKNPRRHSRLSRAALGAGLRLWPSLFAEYTHYTLIRDR